MIQQGDGTGDMVSGSEDGAELLSRIGKFHPGPLQACVSLAGPPLSSVQQSHLRRELSALYHAVSCVLQPHSRC